jgi:TonB family protein
VWLLLPSCFRAGRHHNSFPCLAGHRVSRIRRGPQIAHHRYSGSYQIRRRAKKFPASRHALSHPNHREWFLKSFGGTEAPRLEAKYVELGSKPSDWLQKRIEGVAKHTQTDVTIKVFQKPVDANLRFYKVVTDAMVTEFPIYEAIGGTDFLGDFVYVDGGFRYLDKQVLLALSHSPPMRIKIGGNVQAAKLVDKVQPIYPLGAKQDHIQGNVALSVVIGTDGTVGDISLISGPPELAQSAIDAVKQWRYQPTTLNGNPVEVATRVDILFSLVP